MADWVVDVQGTPSPVPAAGQAAWFTDQTTKKFAHLDDSGRLTGILSRNDAVASQGPGFAADTYVTNSGLLIPSFGMKAGQLYRWYITLSKTAAGVAGAVFIVRIGTNQSTADAARLTLTATVVQTAAVSQGTLIVTVSVRNVAAAGVIAGAVGVAANSPGLGGGIDGVAASFDNTALAGNYVGLSINGGASAAWTLTSVAGELVG